MPGMIYGDEVIFVLAATKEEALDELRQAGYDEEHGVEDAGWMMRVNYPAEYTDLEEWEASPDFQEDWWESCQAPVGEPRPGVQRAWEVVYD